MKQPSRWRVFGPPSILEELWFVIGPKVEVTAIGTYVHQHPKKASEKSVCAWGVTEWLQNFLEFAPYAEEEKMPRHFLDLPVGTVIELGPQTNQLFSDPQNIWVKLPAPWNCSIEWEPKDFEFLCALNDVTQDNTEVHVPRESAVIAQFLAFTLHVEREQEAGDYLVVLHAC